MSRRPADCQAAASVVTDRPGVGAVVGRDPAGTTWITVREPAQWGAGHRTKVVWDGARERLELDLKLPDALLVDEHGEPLRSRLPLEILVTPQGWRFQSRPSTGHVLRALPGQPWTPLPCFGGVGSALGQARTPQGLGWDPRGFVLVADSGNHRVQVLRPDDGTVVAALGQRNPWGAFQAGDAGGAMTEPVDVAVDPCDGCIYVADRAAGRVHVFGPDFGHRLSFRPRPEADPSSPSRPVAVAVLGPGRVAVADTGWPRILIFQDGALVDQVSLTTLDHPRFRGLQLAASYETEGHIVLGPLDSSVHDVAWHDVALEAELPPGTLVELQSWATNTLPADHPALLAQARWAPETPVPWTDASQDSRLVLADWSEWQTWLASDRSADPPRPTDRGRYQFVRLTLRGMLIRASDTTARATPTLAALRVRFPRPSLLRWMPGRWAARDDARDPSGAVFVERFLSLVEGVLTSSESKLEDVPRLLNPRTAPPGWLEWIATWLDLSFDPSWDEDRRRALLLEAMQLYRKRGTPQGLQRYVEIYTGQRPVLVEGFQSRVSGGALQLGAPGLGVQPLGPASAVDPDRGAHTFALYAVVGPTSDPGLVRASIQKIVDAEKPAHTHCELHLVEPDARVGCQSTVGVDLVLGHGLPTCTPLGDSPVGTLTLAPPSFHRAPSPTLDDAGVSLDDRLRLT